MQSVDSIGGVLSEAFRVLKKPEGKLSMSHKPHGRERAVEQHDYGGPENAVHPAAEYQGRLQTH